tara:strand:+ start:198 stop:482 length:285 start_codon:yes stop_codon:yes gene_type:complete
MDIDTLIRVAAVALAAVLLFSTINFSYWFDKVKSVFKWPFKRSPRVVVPVQPETVTFLEIVDLWHQLKESCDSYGLKEASSKLDEVFPLLNVEE